jgi:hypothetical protein
MGNKATMSPERNGSEADSKGIVHEVGELAEGVVTLVELQGQLFAADVKEYSQRSFPFALVLASGIAMGLACFPVALAAGALMLAEYSELSLGPAFLIAAFVGALFSSLLCVFGWLYVRRHLRILQRSQQELVCNLNWIRSMLERNRNAKRKCYDRTSRRVP